MSDETWESSACSDAMVASTAWMSVLCALDPGASLGLELHFLLWVLSVSQDFPTRQFALMVAKTAAGVAKNNISLFKMKF